MTERKTLTIKVLELDVRDADRPLSEFIAEAQAALDSIPPEFRHTAIFMSDDVGYDESRYEFWAEYTRPETDEELATRLNTEAAYAEQRRVDRERAEAREYARLKAKFDPTPS